MDQGSPSQPLQSQVSPRDLHPPPLPCCHSASCEGTRRCLPVLQYVAHWRRDICIWRYLGDWKDFMSHPFPTASWPWCPCRPPSFVVNNKFSELRSLKQFSWKREVQYLQKKVCVGENLVISEIFVAGLGEFLARAFLHIAQVLYVLVANPVTIRIKPTIFSSSKTNLQ